MLISQENAGPSRWLKVETLSDVQIELRQTLDIEVFNSSSGHKEERGPSFKS